MRTPIVLGIMLIVAGFLALAYGQYAYNNNVRVDNVPGGTDATPGALTRTTTDGASSTIPISLGVLSIIAGAGLLLYSYMVRKRVAGIPVSSIPDERPASRVGGPTHPSRTKSESTRMER